MTVTELEIFGRELTAIVRDEVDGNDRLTFVSGDDRWEMTHYQNCCENVRIEEIIGDLGDLVNDGPVLLAEEVSDADGHDTGAESYTWTFYKFRTLNGDVTIRWLGESNGYYSEYVYFSKVDRTLNALNGDGK